MACLAVAGAIVLKVIDYGWTAYDMYQYSSILLDPNSSPEAIAQAKNDLFTAVVLEGLEPDDLFPFGIPLDDIVRHWDDIAPILASATLSMGGRGGGYRFINGIDTLTANGIVRQITTRLDTATKDLLRDEARRVFDVVKPGVRTANSLDIHHRIPLEWAHLFPNDNPNRIDNLVGLDHNIHTQVNSEWRAFKRGLNGQPPTPGQVQNFAASLDSQYGQFYQ